MEEDEGGLCWWGIGKREPLRYINPHRDTAHRSLIYGSHRGFLAPSRCRLLLGGAVAVILVLALLKPYRDLRTLRADDAVPRPDTPVAAGRG